MTKPMTITEKILAAHAGREVVHPGELIQVRVDMALANDITAPLAIRVFREIGAGTVFDPERVALVADHFVPNKDIASAEQARILKDFGEEQKLTHVYDPGNGGVEHVILPEKGLVGPGDLVIGADSHTCTYGALGAFSAGVGSTDLGAILATGSTWLKVPPAIRVVFEGELQPWVGGKDLILYTLGRIGVEGANYKTLEFTGPAVERLSMADRFTMANMAVEGGAKNGIVVPDDVTRTYVSGRTCGSRSFWRAIRTRITTGSCPSTRAGLSFRSPFPTPRTTSVRSRPRARCHWTRSSSGHARTAGWRTSARPHPCSRGAPWRRA